MTGAKRISAISIALLCSILWAHGSLAAPIVVLESADLAPYQIAIDAIEDAVGTGVSTVTIARDKKALDATVQEIWQASPEVIVALGARALDLASSEFQGVPVIFGLVADPSQYMHHPNVVGGIGLIPGDAQVLRSIRSLLPHARGVVVLCHGKEDEERATSFDGVAADIGFNIHHISIQANGSLLRELQGVARTADCLVISPDATLLSSKVFVDLAAMAFEVGLPVFAYSSSLARIGALAAVEADCSSVGSELGRMARDVLREGSGRHLPVKDPPEVRISVNKAMANEFDIEFAPGIASSIRFVGQ